MSTHSLTSKQWWRGCWGCANFFRDVLSMKHIVVLETSCQWRYVIMRVQGHSSTHHTIPFCWELPSNAALSAVVFPFPHCATAMADSASESDTDGAGSSSATPMSSSASNSGKPSIVISQFRLEELTNRLASLQQENKVLKIELETFKLKCKALQEENRDLRKASVTIVSSGSLLTSSDAKANATQTTTFVSQLAKV